MRATTLTFIISAFLVAATPAFAVERSDQTNAKIEKIRDFGISTAKRGCSKSGRLTTEPVTNRHDPRITDQIQKIACPGLDIRYYVAYAHTPPAKILDSVEITSRNLKLPLGLKLGMPRSDIERVLGVPDSSRPNAITYFAPVGEAGGNDGVTFILEQGALIKVSVTFHY